MYCKSKNYRLSSKSKLRKQIINNKRYIKFGESIDEIIKYLVGWKKSIKNQ